MPPFILKRKTDMQTNAAETIVREWTEEHHGVVIPKAETLVRTDDIQGWKIAKARELLERIERGELDGARCSFAFSGNCEKMSYVEVSMPRAPKNEEERERLGDRVCDVRMIIVSFEPKTPALKVV